ncbi:uncharacterized protein MYCFIDRAFT_85685 [Pseudocercospora fijiensis CIRAD86]|uniref:AB hydrolase-1 domain-containing protein n=1 Tax=Pseudocercospora fijiensis (strain CIRAD86) TaxID=383855 RepID=N1Q790_PSEFD|nr:uncharacterized protein MYCFIDRAFT_85685 [Pseudocercospora fijiensis CIRAD86]EME87431.1 hypothetical protein MYCFIDRAFT_85685 [Pseudocercospora fijiensis CIRAD86]
MEVLVPWNGHAEQNQGDFHSDHRSQQRSPNRIKSRPANPKVLTSIIDSFDTLAPLPPGIQPHELFSETASQHSRAESSRRSVASTASIHKPRETPGFGVTYGADLELDDVHGLTDAALPPIIPTSRPPSGLSHRRAQRPNAKKPPTILHTPSSRRSSVGVASVDRPENSRNKLSSESWVRSKTSTVADDSVSLRGRASRKHRLRRVGSQEKLRAEDANRLTNEASFTEKRMSLAEQIIAKTPAKPPAPKPNRLYLNDATISEAPPTDERLKLLRTNSFGERSEGGDSRVSKASSERRLSVYGNASLQSPSPIQDSIPMRTSSLRHPSRSPAGKRKHKKSKRNAASSSKSERMPYKPSKSIPDEKWADLGDDDETVRRIKELREQRKSRQEESTSYPPSVENSLAPLEASESQHIPVYERSAPPPDEAKRGSRKATTANRKPIDPTKAHTTLGIRGDGIRSLDLNGPAFTANRAASSDPSSRNEKFSLAVKRPQSDYYRPAPSRSADHSPAGRLSLDYSYAQAVDLLQEEDLQHALERERSRSRSRPVAPNRSSSLGLKAPELPPPERHQSTLAVPQHAKSTLKKKRPPQDRWTAHHPDLPLAFDKKKNRRKSMSDARLARQADDVSDSPRRDSIEDAVIEYLSAPRLNRKVKHPLTGRTIAFSEIGDPEGAAVFVCVGMGLTRYVTAFYDELAMTLRLRLITLDRPGVGGSEPYPPNDKTGPLGWPEDVLAICQHLGIVKFSILAHSAGAIYALATALILPHLVRGKVHLLAPWVPPSQLEAISHPTASAPPANPLPRSQRLLRVLPTPFLKAANSSFMTATSASLKPASKRNVKSTANKSSPRRATNPPEMQEQKPNSRDRPEYNRRESMMLMDRYMPATNPTDHFPIPVKEEEEHDQFLKRGSLVLSATSGPMDPGYQQASSGLNAAEHAEKERQMEYTSRLTQMTWDLATRDSNPATDLVVCLERHRDVGFRYTDVGAQVVITHGSEDKRVPLANVKWMAEQMNRRALGLDSLGAVAVRDSWVDTGRGGCEVRVLEGEGHGLMASPVIMGDVLTEIAAEWAGQGRGNHL